MPSLFALSKSLTDCFLLPRLTSHTIHIACVFFANPHSPDAPRTCPRQLPACSLAQARVNELEAQLAERESEIADLHTERIANRRRLEERSAAVTERAMLEVGSRPFRRPGCDDVPKAASFVRFARSLILCVHCAFPLPHLQDVVKRQDEIIKKQEAEEERQATQIKELEARRRK